MASDDLKNSSHSDILQNSLTAPNSYSKFDLEEDKIKQSLLERPRFSVKARLTLLFFILFLVSAAVSITAMFMLSMINYRVQYMSLSDRIANEIQHTRRIEKNYFLYNSDLSEVKEHIANANALLEQASLELGHVVGRQEIDNIREYLDKYNQIVDELIAKANDPTYKQSEEFKETSQALRNYGSKIPKKSASLYPHRCLWPNVFILFFW
jgi:hypothetical protein